MENVHVRDFASSDIEKAKEIHEANHFNFKFPDLFSPLFIIKKVVEVDGEVVAIVAGKIETELYLWVSHDNANPEQRWAAVQQLNEAFMEEAYWEKGVDQCVCWVPVVIEKSFAKRLKSLGFSRDRDGFHSWSRMTKEPAECG